MWRPTRESVGELVRTPEASTQRAEQRGRDLRVLHDDHSHDGRVELERLGVLERRDGRRSRRVVEESHLADHITGAELRENERCVARLVSLDTDAPARDDMQGVTGIALSHDHDPGSEMLRTSPLREHLEAWLGQLLEQRHTGQR